MAVTVYKSSDASAPVLNGQAGSLCTVLDAVLVNGYGAKAAAGWASVTAPGPTQPNRRIYRAPSGAMRPYFRVQDDAPSNRGDSILNIGLGREAFIRGMESEPPFDSALGYYFPTILLAANGIVVRKSARADSAPVPWIAVADARTLYFFNDTSDYVGYSSFMFGEYYSLKATTDYYNGLIIGRVVPQPLFAPTVLPASEVLDTLSALTVGIAGHFLPRSWADNIPSSIPVGKHGNAAHSILTLVGLLAYPNLPDGGLYLSPVWIHEPGQQAIIRGRMRGFWHFLHPVASDVKDGDTWSGSGETAGKTFMAIKPTALGTGLFVLETSNTWETN